MILLCFGVEEVGRNTEDEIYVLEKSSQRGVSPALREAVLAQHLYHFWMTVKKGREYQFRRNSVSQRPVAVRVLGSGGGESLDILSPFLV